MFLKTFLFLKKNINNILHIFYNIGNILFYTFIKKSEFNQKLLLSIIQQLYNIGILSLIITMISGLFIGMVLSLQGYFILLNYGSVSNLGLTVALSLFREFGSVITALLFIGSVGSSFTAEIAFMKITEQLSSLEIMAVDPLRKIIAPRFWAGVISMPLLTIIFITFGILGSWIVGVYLKDIDNGFFWASMDGNLQWNQDSINCLIKSIIFAIFITSISLFNGYRSKSTFKSISIASTKTVIYSSLVILGLDLFLTFFMCGNF
ncbi:MlaE family lipid ABC transporter permease subunit [Sodalis-like secondary symbiont of Drepanosiphum platanoidis]|uniref:MlaE family lipid ABC transporter permease subunit n=1 Tax=Sodalis-like secondary symbiont of Drepanosiphum platanoidis TaxID=2994493 RepID=UPI0034643FE1